jgi:uncharacterized protein YcfJ
MQGPYVENDWFFCKVALSYGPLQLKQIVGYQPGGHSRILIIKSTEQLQEYKVEMNRTTKSIHPLVAGAAASVMLVSLVGVAAITGLFPTSHGTIADNPHIVAQPAAAVASVPAFAVAPAAVQQAAPIQKQQFVLVPVQAQQQAATPIVAREIVKHKTIVHHKYVQHAAPVRPAQYTQYAQAEPSNYNPHPVDQQARANSVSPLGMGLGAVVGGLVGSQVGGGNGKTLATIAGAVGGGYLGNEVAKRYP